MFKPEESRYMKSHEWAFLTGKDTVVGISDYAQKEITDVVYVELPKLGRKVSQGEAIAVVESVKAAFDIYAPLSGEVIAVNEALNSNPALLNLDPHGAGWLFKIQASSGQESKTLMNFDQYQDFLKTEAH